MYDSLFCESFEWDGFSWRLGDDKGDFNRQKETVTLHNFINVSQAWNLNHCHSLKDSTSLLHHHQQHNLTSLNPVGWNLILFLLQVALADSDGCFYTVDD